LLALARRVSVLHRICYHYRAARDGSRSNLGADERYLETIDNRARIFDLLDRCGVPAGHALRRLAHERFLLGGLGQLGTVGVGIRRRYFTHMAEVYRSQVPDGLSQWSVVNRLKRRLVVNDAWWVFLMGSRAMRLGRRCEGAAWGAGRLLRRYVFAAKRGGFT
jgi:hypothetical protein